MIRDDIMPDAGWGNADLIREEREWRQQQLLKKARENKNTSDPYEWTYNLSQIKEKQRANSSVRGTGHWIETFLTISSGKLKIKANFINDNRVRGYTGCALIEILDSTGELLAESVHRRGVNGTGTNGRKIKTEHSEIDVSIIQYLSGITVRVIQKRCSKPWESRLGSTIKDTAVKPLREGVRVVLDVVKIGSKIKDTILAEANRALGKISGENAQEAFNNLIGVVLLVDEKFLISTLDGIIAFADSGDLDDLNPLYALAAGEIKKSRAQLWPLADEIPEDVLDKMPDELHEILRKSRMIKGDKTMKLSFPKFSMDAGTPAIVIDDIIIFKEIPGSEETEDLHLWAHEAYHLLQYKALGVEEFMRTYLALQMAPTSSGGDTINPMEKEADLFACKHFWVEDPAYLETCPINSND